jgi:hypothetical protein
MARPEAVSRANPTRGHGLSGPCHVQMSPTVNCPSNQAICCRLGRTFDTPQPTRRTAALTGYCQCVPVLNDGRPLVGIEGQICLSAAVVCTGAYALFLQHSCIDLSMVVVASSFSLRVLRPLCCGRLPMRPCTQRHLSSLQERPSTPPREADVQGGQGIGVDRLAGDDVYLSYSGMHGVPHLWSMRASIVARIVVMGQGARGT